MSDDADAVRAYLRAAGDWSWTRPEDEKYVTAVAARMAELRAEYMSDCYPAPIHGADEIGACRECDALKVLAWGRCADLED